MVKASQIVTDKYYGHGITDRDGQVLWSRLHRPRRTSTMARVSQTVTDKYYDQGITDRDEQKLLVLRTIIDVANPCSLVDS